MQSDVGADAWPTAVFRDAVFLLVNFHVYVYVDGQPQGIWDVLKSHFIECHFCCQLIESNFENIMPETAPRDPWPTRKTSVREIR